MKGKVLIVGVGNTLRSDDGIGAYICTKIEQLPLDGVTTFVTQQLHTELVELLLQYDTTIIVDAAIGIDKVTLQPLQQNNVQPVSTSHHINANMLAALAKLLYQKELSMMLCAVPAENVDMGETLSTTAKNKADEAIRLIRIFIETGKS